jgi:hypothetical protein
VGVAFAALALLVAAIAYAVDVFVGWGTACPGHGSVEGDFDRPVSLWPPGTPCSDGSQGFVNEPLPWIKFVVIGLAACAALAFVCALWVDFRQVRSVPHRKVLDPSSRKK